MKGDKIPGEDHLLRNVPFSKLRKADGCDDVIGVLPSAFVMREVDAYLSATWVEYFQGSRAERIAKAVGAIRLSSLKVAPKSGFTVGNVDAIRAACATKRHNIRVVHEPEDDNDAHVAVRRFPPDEWELFALLAEEAWSEWFLNSSVASVS